MKRRALGAAVAAALVALGLPGSSGGHAGHGPTFVGIANFAFAPASVTVVEGDQVIWGWTGPGTNHSVTSEAGQAESFDSDPGKTAIQVNHPVNDGFSHTFAKAGTYRYACKVHSFMKGEVKVLKAGTVGDRVPPVISAARITPTRPCSRRTRRCAHPGAKLYYTLSEAADMGVEIARRGAPASADPLRTSDTLGHKGRNRITLPVKNLGAGTYRVTMSALDGAQNLSKTVRLTLTIRAS